MSTSYLEYVITISYAPFIGIVFMMIYLFANSRTDKDVKLPLRIVFLRIVNPLLHCFQVLQP